MSLNSPEAHRKEGINIFYCSLLTRNYPQIKSNGIAYEDFINKQ